MNTRRIVISATLLVSISMSTACSTRDPVTDSPSAKGAALVFDEPYSATGHLQVYQDDEGRLGVVVTGGIGADDPLAIRSRLSDSIVTLYTGLTQGTRSVPEKLVDLDKQLEKQRLVDLSGEPPAPEPLEVPKDVNSFNQTLCTTITMADGSKRSPLECWYYYNTLQVCTRNTYQPGWWSYAWNEAPSSGTQQITGLPQTAVQWNPWTWNVSTWLGVGYNRQFCLTSPYCATPGCIGNLGITIHMPYSDVR